MRYSVVTIDLDGTLIDTAAEIAEAANRTLAQFGVERQPIELISTFIGAGTRQMMLRLMAHLTMAQPALIERLPPDEVLHALERHYGATVGVNSRPYDGVEAALERLRENGVRCALVTNKELRFAQKLLKVHHLAPYFSYVVGGDTLPQKKPDPAVMAHVLRVMGGEAHRAAHLGDSQVDVDTARQAGMAAWAVPWGYNGGEPITQARPDRIFNSYAEVAEFVVQANDAYTSRAAA